MWKIWQVTQLICTLISFAFLTYQFWKGYETCTLKDVTNIYSNLSQRYASLGHDKLMSPPIYHIAVVTKHSNSISKWCGGSLISRNHILTAAHCLEGSNKTTIILYKELNNTQYTTESSCIKQHPKWQPQLLSNDIALIELPRTLHLPDLNPIKISQNAKVTCKTTTVYGWKKNTKNQPILSKYEVVVIKNKHCARYYGSLITKRRICARTKGLEDGCHGFSGSALVLEGLLVGVMSFGTDPCDVGYPKVYTKVSPYRKWIARNIGEDRELCVANFTLSDQN